MSCAVADKLADSTGSTFNTMLCSSDAVPPHLWVCSSCYCSFMDEWLWRPSCFTV